MKADLERAGYDPKRWATALPRIALSMNRQPHTSLGMRSRYEVMFNRKPRWEDPPELAFRTTATLNDIEDEPVNILNNNPDQVPSEQDPHGSFVFDSDDSTLLNISESQPGQQSNSRMEQLSLHIGMGPPPPLPARPSPSLPTRIAMAETEHTVTASSGLPPLLPPRPMLFNLSNAIHFPSQAPMTNL
jgi:hypothetical protein